MGMFDGKAGLVTGAASGIGRASAMAFAREGGSVVVADLEESRTAGEETVRLIQDAGGSAHFAPCDVANEDDARALVSALVNRYGSLDFAHNNAGVAVVGSVTDLSEKDFSLAMDVNVKGVWLGMKYQLQQMYQQRSGAIVNTSSLAGLIATQGSAAYVASKHAVVGLTKAAALDAADFGVRVNAICPASTKTAMFDGMPEELKAQAIAPQAIKRMAEPAEIAESAVWLCASGSSFITGIALPVDAGASAQ